MFHSVFKFLMLTGYGRFSELEGLQQGLNHRDCMSKCFYGEFATSLFHWVNLEIYFEVRE